MIDKLTFNNYPNCLRFSNGTIDLVVSTDFGPRILFYGPAGGENILGLHPQARVETAIGEWRPYGGHRLWMAPENMPLSYAPDNEPVEVAEDGIFSARFVSAVEAAAGIQKEMTVTVGDAGSDAVIEHRITNRADREIELSVWALTIMRAGGAAVVPHEKFEPYGPETLLPVRSMALWSYTDFTDARWQFEKDKIRLRVDENLPSPQKIGVLNRQGWAAYEWGDLLFVKKFDFVENAVFPDLNSNTEIYTAGGFVEVETLSPLTKIAPGESTLHTERWQLFENKKLEDVISG